MHHKHNWFKKQIKNIPFYGYICTRCTTTKLRLGKWVRYNANIIQHYGLELIPKDKK